MPSKNLHSEPFDEATLTKLDIFREYLTEWLPVFIHSNQGRPIKIYDFFAGEGQDSEGIFGSPLIILDVINKYKHDILQKNISIQLLFNEFITKKFYRLEKLVQNESSGLRALGAVLDIKIKNEDFAKIFRKENSNLKFGNNLIFLDQNGIKQITKQVFLALSSFPKTDFLFFISSSYLSRFDFKKYHPDLQLGSDFDFSDVHRKVVDYYKGLLPKDSKLKLYPYTLRKPKSGNIYGLIYGSRHPLGIEKFLNIAWDKNKINGEANFDIDEDKERQQLCLPFECRKLTKLEKFMEDLKEFILSKKVSSNKEILDFTLENGHPPKHAVKVLRELRDCGTICHFQHPKINCRQVYTKKNIITFKVKKNEKIQNRVD
jgi:three-Cys-motif partner protein